METITLQQLKNMFAGLHDETDWNLDGEMLWGYYFTAASPKALEAASGALEKRGFDVADLFKGEDEASYVLQVRRVETHTPESLFALNGQLEEVAAGFEGVEYDGMDVNPLDAGDGGECGGCHCEEETVGGCGDCDEECGDDGHGGDHECCGDGGEDHGCGCGSRHVHPEGRPIANPELIDAIDAIKGDQSEPAQYALTLALQRGLYLVPVFRGGPDAQSPDDESLQVLVCSDESGAEFLPLFTDEAALKAWTREKVSAMVLTAPEAWEFILEQPSCAGGVINPGDRALPLNREMVGILKKMIDDTVAPS